MRIPSILSSGGNLFLLSHALSEAQKAQMKGPAGSHGWVGVASQSGTGPDVVPDSHHVGTWKTQ